MIKYTLLFFVFWGFIIRYNTFSQTVYDTRINISGVKTEILYKVKDVTPNNYYYISLEISTDGGKTFIKPSKMELSGDVKHQDDLTPGEKMIIWSKNAGPNIIPKIKIEPFYKLNFEVTDIKITPIDDKIKINYYVKGLDSRDKYFIILTVSEDDWITEYEPNSVSGDIGELKNASDGEKTIIWDVYKDRPDGISEVECDIRLIKQTSVTSDISELLFGNRLVRSKLSGLGLSGGVSIELFDSYYKESILFAGGEVSVTAFPVIFQGYFYYGGRDSSPNGIEQDTLTLGKWGGDVQVGLFPLLSGAIFPSFGVGYGQLYFEHNGSMNSKLVVDSFYAIASINVLLNDWIKFSSSYILPFISEDYKKFNEIKFTLGFHY